MTKGITEGSGIPGLIVEMTDETNISQAFAFAPIACSTGGTISPSSVALCRIQSPTAFLNSSDSRDSSKIIHISFHVLCEKPPVSTTGSLPFLDISFREIQPLFLSTPVELGGLGLPAPAVGHILAVFGVLNGLAQFCLFPGWWSEEVFTCVALYPRRCLIGSKYDVEQESP
ncbi:hypothetical protein BDN71DRAFT_1506594 [Pleurotus eryngii]|uniref:Uncharacterized protein n=1 Tax=Pleurotus eryngii TaxID=5323 RepID=A0A9P6A0J1_PLEER|nr:hypothetical protein BDN71DRAFT_1506594 [Pleurotus eryngii]